MDFNLTTFILEIVNFLVLIWILKWFFYAPVRRVIEARRKAVEEKWAASEEARRTAEDLRTRYDGRLKEWESEKEGLAADFRKSMEEEKRRQMASLQAALQEERKQEAVRAEKDERERLEKIEKEAALQSAAFAARLLSELATPETESRIVELTIRQLSDPRSKACGEFKRGFILGPVAVQIISAFHLGEGTRKELEKALRDLAGHAEGLSLDFKVDPKLLAGLEIDNGSLVWRANLRDELQSFARGGLS